MAQLHDGVAAQKSIFKAVKYVRMSTEHQQYSTENQADKIREYAVRRGIDIIKTYADEGKSGLRIDGRQALQQLIQQASDVRSAWTLQAGNACNTASEDK